MMIDRNPTTRRFSRSLEEAFPSDFYAIQRVKRQQWWYPHEPASSFHADADFWVYVTMAFAAGFLVCYLSLTA